MNVLDLLAFVAGAFYVIDRCYVDLARLYALHQAGAYFVTRAKSPLAARRVYFAPPRPQRGRHRRPAGDAQWLLLGEEVPRTPAPIQVQGPESGKTLIFLTNNTALPALTIAAQYKAAGRSSCFSSGSSSICASSISWAPSENGVKTQVWCAVATYVPIAIVKEELLLDASIYTCLQILSVSLFEKTEISCALQADASPIDLLDTANQVNLFDF